MLSAEQILALSPDDSSAKAAKGLLAPAKWPLLGYDDSAIWGHCQGSGSKPYQVIIDVGTPAFKCSCPSRKFPCKHGLALYLLLAQNQGIFTSEDRPEWVAQWLDARQDRAEKKATAQAEAKPVDPVAAAKREAKRWDRMLAGTADLERWMADMVCQGLADLPGRPSSFWTEPAARLVDAQAGGLAGTARQLESVLRSGDGWQTRLLMGLGRLQLLVDAMTRLDALTEPLSKDVLSAAGWPQDKEEALADTIEDSWQVLGVSYQENDRLWERRVWLRGRAREALLLDFSHGGRRFPQVFVPGSFCKASIAFYPSAAPLRAVLIGETQAAPDAASAPELSASWDAALASVAERLGASPWQQRMPLGLCGAVPVQRGKHWALRDSAGLEAQLRVKEEDGWQLLALSGGEPLACFGEWMGEQLRPLSVWRGNQLCWQQVTV
jgi:hypothetical protein